ncbi:hypothetical protein GCM10022271_22460 [Corallibacter vietnamensis]|uniref:Uncharacterized protein n=1 Tax=Corallibacter vietnamensis TaxID=904130 RepID=A0ABP7HCF1_9FLAO
MLIDKKNLTKSKKLTAYLLTKIVLEIVNKKNKKDRTNTYHYYLIGYISSI